MDGSQSRITPNGEKKIPWVSANAAYSFIHSFISLGGMASYRFRPGAANKGIARQANGFNLKVTHKKSMHFQTTESEVFVLTVESQGFGRQRKKEKTE